MKIEQAINQTKPFRSNHQKVMVNLLFTNNWLLQKQKAFFQSYDITGKQYNVLRILRGAGEPISTSTIRERLLDKMSDASRVVDRLYKKGLVGKNTCPSDKRLVDVFVTTDGEKLLKIIDKKSDELDQITGKLTDREAAQLSNLLDKLRS